MNTQTRTALGRSERDRLEKLQEALREARHRRESLQREKAELLVQTEQLEVEMHGLRRALGITWGELEQPAPSLPDHLLPPFHVSPPLRTLYGRLRRVLKLLPASVGLCAHMVLGLLGHPHFFFGVGGMILVLLGVLFFSQAPEDGDGFTHWSFDTDGFFPANADPRSGKVLYREIQQATPRQGWLERLSGLGSVRVTWSPGASTSLGHAAHGSDRIVDLRLVDDPKRLAAWLRERAEQTRGGAAGGAHDG